MIPTRRATSAFLACVALLSFSTPLDEVAFQPEEGASLTKSIEIVGEFALDDFSAIVDGQDVGAMIPSIELVVETKTAIAVTDEYEATEDGRPTRLQRTFDDMESIATVSVTTDFGAEDQEITSSSELDGQAVVFTWDPEEEQYEVAFVDDEGDEELLEGLAEDMDLRALLPPDEVSADDTWEVDLQELLVLVAPGGDLRFRPDEMPTADFEDLEIFEELFADQFTEDFSDIFEGSCECTYKGSTTEDDLTLAEVHVSIEVASATDLSDMFTEILDAMSDQVGEEIPIVIELADFNLDFEGEGVLLWDLSAGRIHSFEMSGDADIAIDVGLSSDEEGMGTAEISLEMSGGYEYELSTDE